MCFTLRSPHPRATVYQSTMKSCKIGQQNCERKHVQYECMQKFVPNQSHFNMSVRSLLQVFSCSQANCAVRKFSQARFYLSKLPHGNVCTETSTLQQFKRSVAICSNFKIYLIFRILRLFKGANLQN